MFLLRIPILFLSFNPLSQCTSSFHQLFCTFISATLHRTPPPPPPPPPPSALTYMPYLRRSRVVSPVRRFARESFRPESFRPWVVSPLFGGSFRPCFLLKHQGLSQAMFGDIYGGLDFPTIIFRWYRHLAQPFPPSHSVGDVILK